MAEKPKARVPGELLDEWEKRFRPRAETMLQNDGMGFDPMTILAIITAIVPLVADCFSGPLAVRRNLANRCRDRSQWMRVGMAFRKADPRLSWKRSLVLAQEVFAVADLATNEEVEGFVADCCGH